ncbi:MAG TPA: hypothetical protein VF062_05425 [Candidatus Limnocylindrales bacterium]
MRRSLSPAAAPAVVLAWSAPAPADEPVRNWATRVGTAPILSCPTGNNNNTTTTTIDGAPPPAGGITISGSVSFCRDEGEARFFECFNPQGVSGIACATIQVDRATGAVTLVAAQVPNCANSV